MLLSFLDMRAQSHRIESKNILKILQANPLKPINLSFVQNKCASTNSTY